MIPTQEMAMDYVLNNQRGPGGSGVSSQVGGSNSAAGTVPPAPGGGGSTAAAGNSDVGRANANAAANARAGGVEGAAGAGQVGPYRGVAPVPLSAADQEAQMQQALQASLTQTSGGGGGSAQGSGDSELQRALELSKKEARTKSNPYLRKREEGVPVGLRNSGNTCYFNALLQVMFYLRPQLFRAVLEFNPDMVDVVAAQRAEEAAEQARAALAAEQAAIIERSESSESADGDTDGADADATSAIGDMPEDPAAPLPTFEPTARERAAVEFTQHWQRLYASLLLSQRKFLDAKHAVDALFRFSGDTSQSGAQHDIMEFYEHIFSALQTAFESCRHHPRLLEELFMCHTSQETVVVNPDTDERVDVETQHALIKDFQLNVSAGDMYRGLDDFFITEIEGYRIDGTDVRTTAKQTTWIEELPRVLSIQLKRVQYDRSKGDMVKVNSRFDFDQEIFLDRYLLSNREEVMSRRTRLAELDKLRAELSDELGRLSNFQDLGVPLDKAIGATSVLLQEPEKHEELVDRAAIDDAKLEAARSVITALKKRVEERMESLSHDIETTSKQIKNLFSDLNSERYVLLAVSVHDGQFAHRGHYWTFVRDFAKSQWFKYNDAQVLPVGEELVMLESIGGNTTASAYFFVYVRAEDAETVSALPESELINLIPPHAREGVEADNVAFSTELTDWDEQQWKQELESHINTFVSNFEDTVRTLMRVASSYSPHISSFADKAMRLDDLTEDPRLASLISISAALRRNSVVDALTLKRLVEELDIPNPAMRAYVLDAVRSKLIAKYKFCAAGIPVGLTDRYPMALALRMHSQLASSSADDPNNENDEEAPIEMSFTESVRIELEHVQAAFLAFQNDTRLFLHGLRALQAEQFEDAFHLLFSCLSWGGDVKFSRRYETVVYLMLTIYKLFGQVFREIHAPETQGRRRVELLLSLVPLTKKVAFVCLTHPAKRYASHMLGQLRECWVSALELVQEDGSEEELERIQSGLNSLLTDMASSYRLKFDVPETVQVDEDAIPPASLDDRAIFDCHRELSRAVCKKYAQEIDEVALLCVKNEPAPGLAS